MIWVDFEPCGFDSYQNFNDPQGSVTISINYFAAQDEPFRYIVGRVKPLAIGEFFFITVLHVLEEFGACAKLYTLDKHAVLACLILSWHFGCSTRCFLHGTAHTSSCFGTF